MLFTKMERARGQRLSKPCSCKNASCGALNDHYEMIRGETESSLLIQATPCKVKPEYTLDGLPLCTACARFRRLPT